MRIRVGSIIAHCEKCGGEEFQAPPEDSHQLACTACGARAGYHALLAQIFDETVKRAEVFLELARRRRCQ